MVNPGTVDILGFNYRLGDLRLPGQGGLPPVVTGTNQLTFVNKDDPRAIYHSITSCKAPCNRETGIAYPLADGKVSFESGTLGTSRPITTGALTLQDASGAEVRHVHVLLPDPSVHARRLPSQEVAGARQLRSATEWSRNASR